MPGPGVICSIYEVTQKKSVGSRHQICVLQFLGMPQPSKGNCGACRKLLKSLEAADFPSTEAEMKIHKLMGLANSREMGLTVPDKHDFLTKNTFLELTSPKSTTPSSSAAAGVVHTKPCISWRRTWAAD